MSVVSSSFRSRVRASAEPIARAFGRVGLTPNMLTLIGFGISVIGALLAAAGAWLPAGLVIAAGSIFDLFDGALARATGTTSRFGAFLDSTFDRAGEAAVYVGIAFGFLRNGVELGGLLAITAMSAAFMVSYVRAKSESLGFTPGTGMANVGLAPREVRMAALVIGLLAAPFTLSPASATSAGIAVSVLVALGLISIFASFTTAQRIYHVYQQAKKENHG